MIAIVDTGVDLGHGGLQGSQLLTLTGLETELQDAITYARGKGVTIIAAAGNDCVPLCDFPGFDAGVLCVVSTDRRELRSAFSAGPIRPDLNAVSAPGGSLVPSRGQDIVSTVPAGTSSSGATCGYGDSYDKFAGTSMATPHVAGVAALLAARCSLLRVARRTTSTPP